MTQPREEPGSHQVARKWGGANQVVTQEENHGTSHKGEPGNQPQGGTKEPVTRTREPKIRRERNQVDREPGATLARRT